VLNSRLLQQAIGGNVNMSLGSTGRIAVRPLSPILKERAFLPAAKSGSTEVSLQGNSITLTHTSPLGTSRAADGQRRQNISITLVLHQCHKAERVAQVVARLV